MLTAVPQFSVFSLISSFAKLLGGSQKSDDDLSARFVALGYENDTLANSILAVLVGCTVELSQGSFLNLRCISNAG